MSLFKISITGGDTPIELGNEVLDVEVFLDTVKENVLTRSSGVLAKLEIKGQIDENNPAPYVEMFRWAKDFKSKTQYRKVELAIFKGTDGEEARYRRFEFGSMFVVDYKENYYKEGDEKSQYGSFQLNLTQKDDNWDSVETLPN